MYTNCEYGGSKCAAISSNLCSACNDMPWFPSHSGCCPCRQTCEGQQCGSGGLCSQGCIDGYYGDFCMNKHYDDRCINQVYHRHNGTCIHVADVEPQNTGDASQTSSVVGPAVGSAVGALSFVCVITVIVLYKRRYRLKLLVSRTPHVTDNVAGNTRDESTTDTYELPDTSRDDNISPYDELTIYHEYDEPTKQHEHLEMNDNQVEPDDLATRYENLQIDATGV